MIEVGAVLAPALFAGAVAIGVTVAIERLGGVVGGFLGTLPSTIVPAAIGIWAQSADQDAFAAAMCAAPAGMWLNALFLWLWRAVPPHLPELSLGLRLTAMTGIGLAGWAAGALGLVWGLDELRATGGSMVLVGTLATLAILVTGIAACWSTPPAPKGSKPVGLVTLLARGLLAAGAIGLSVWLAAVGGAVAAGVASVFPAIFLTTMVGLWLAQGEAVPSGAVGPMMLGSTSVAAYAVLAVFSLPLLGVALGSLVAWLACALGVTLPLTLWTRRRRALLASAAV